MEDGTEIIEAGRKRRLRFAVLKWYDKHGRQLPWRVSADPYRIWLSEIMLQQTTVATVMPYFERFKTKFPDVHSLAAADVDDVLRIWEGLGYYSRARNLHKAAQLIVAEHDGHFPTDAVVLQSLPGIGRYTAGALLSFAFARSAAIVEANTERLYARLMALKDDVRSASSQRMLWQFAEKIVPQRRPGDFNQALMDIGSAICRPQDPDCKKCPLIMCCNAFQQGLQNEVPRRKPRTPTTSVNEAGIVLHRKGKYLLRRRTNQERWAGMWDFVRFEIDHAEVCGLPFTQQKKESRKTVNVRQASLFTSAGQQLPETFQDRIHAQAGCRSGSVLQSMEFSYSVTRYRIRLWCFLCEAEEVQRKKNNKIKWFSKPQLGELPLSKTAREIANWLESLNC